MIKDQQIKGNSFFHKTLDAGAGLGYDGRQCRREAAELPRGERGQHKGLLLLVAQVTPIHGRVGEIVFYPKHLVQTKQKKGYWGEDVLANCPPPHFSGGSKGQAFPAWLQSVGA